MEKGLRGMQYLGHLDEFTEELKENSSWNDHLTRMLHEVKNTPEKIYISLAAEFIVSKRINGKKSDNKYEDIIDEDGKLHEIKVWFDYYSSKFRNDDIRETKDDKEYRRTSKYIWFIVFNSETKKFYVKEKIDLFPSQDPEKLNF